MAIEYSPDADRADATEPQPLERRGRPRQQNSLDVLVDNLADWMLDTSREIADAVMGGLAAPFAEQLSEQEKLAYYERALFNPDGTPNVPGRDREVQRLGPEGF